MRKAKKCIRRSSAKPITMIGESPAPTDERFPYWPAGLSEPLAAKYIGVSQTTLRWLQATGQVAKVAVTKARFVYRRVELDRFLARLAGDEQNVEVNEWEAV